MRKLSVTLLLTVASGLTHAANPISEATQNAITACMAISNLEQAWVGAAPVVFPEDDPVVAVLVRGIKQPPAMKKQAGAELCLYSLKAKSARLAEWDGVADDQHPLRPAGAAANM